MPTPPAWQPVARAILAREREVKRTPIRRKPRPDDDKVTPEVYDQVMSRDEYRCMAPLLDIKAGICHNQWGSEFGGIWRPSMGRLGAWLTLDHVPDLIVEKKGMTIAGGDLGGRAPSDPQHLIVICWGHHLGRWATSNRELEREYLATRYR